MYEFAVTPAVTQLRRPGVIITEVTPGSVGEELELRPNDRIVRVNGRPVRDYLEQRWVDIAKTFIIYEVIASRAVAIMCIVLAWFYPRAVTLNRLVFFILMQSFIGQNPGGYAIILVTFLFFCHD